MRRSIRIASLALLAFISTSSSSLAGPAGSDGCPGWATGFEFTGTGGAPVCYATFDDGSGAALYAGGTFERVGDVEAAGLARWDGSSWSAVGGPMENVSALLAFDDGSGAALYAAGTSTITSTTARVARWDGSSWTSLGGAFNGPIRALEAYDGGSGLELYATGHFLDAGGTAASYVARWDGTAWSALGSGLSSYGACLEVFDDGGGPALYVGGIFTLAGGVPANRVARWDSSSWSGVGGGTNNGVFTLAAHDDGAGTRLFAGGTFSQAGGNAAAFVAVWDGFAWSAVGAAPSSPVKSLASFDDGSGAALYAAGDFTSFGTVAVDRIARWDGTAWSGFGGPDDATAATLHVHDDGVSEALLVGGTFAGVEGEQALGFARWDGASWSTLETHARGNGLNDGVVCLAAGRDPATGDPVLFAGGAFTAAGEVAASGLAAWDTTGWRVIGGGVGPLPFVGTLALLPTVEAGWPVLYAGGGFTRAGDQPVGYIARWDGTAWDDLGGGADQKVQALALWDDGGGPAVYAGGRFTQIGGASAMHIARWDGAAWSPLGAGADGDVLALAVFDDGSGGGPALYAGGTFSQIGGQPISRIARWDGSWQPVGSWVQGHVLTLAVLDLGAGPALYAGGYLTGSSVVARWDGQVWSSVGVELEGSVHSLTVFDEGAGAHPTLFAGGSLRVDGYTGVHGLAKWDGSAWSPVGDEGGLWTGGALARFRDPHGEPRLFVGGTFSAIPGAPPSSFIAAWTACANSAVPYCFGDGSATACPCANSGSEGHGCAGSIGAGALLEASGSSSLAAGDMMLGGSALPPGQPGLYFQGETGVAGGAGTVFGDGLRCVETSVVRLEVRTADASGASITTVDVGTAGGAAPGETRYYQLWTRDPGGPCGSGFNLSNGLRVIWTP